MAAGGAREEGRGGEGRAGPQRRGGVARARGRRGESEQRARPVKPRRPSFRREYYIIDY